jgi:aryl-alcohol dehydrogenase-like predicted oxidoreductase
MKLALGTVQFGLDYGVSNQLGQVSKAEINEILALANQASIKTLDCAAAYGDSEQTIGQSPQSKYFDIVTKIPHLQSTETSLVPYFQQSLKSLNRTTIDTLLLHDVNNILQHPNSDVFCHELNQLKIQKKVNRIGISVYTPEQIVQAIKKLNIDVVQAPLNLFDQRFCAQSTIEILSQHNIKLHARSIFLQGLLLMGSGTWPEYFSPYLSYLNKLDELSKHSQLTKLTLAMAFLLQNSLIEPYLEKLVVGCCSAAQLEEIIQSYQQALTLPLGEINWGGFSCPEPALINPSYW